MKSRLWAVVAVSFILSGCRSVEIPSSTRLVPTRHPVQSVIQASAGLRMEMFDETGKRVQELPHARRGSVSIYTKDETGQDNYTFDEDGMIVKHLRSYGANYARGVWEEVK